ncbi:MAG: Hsp20/alpha crystallin family protein [Nitrospirae bacterium]|nr:Hsp20/alpha crystallin family protein [Nitrospirota bacterium]
MLWSELERFGRFLDPWREFESMNRALARLSAPVTVEFPAVNLWASEEHAVVTAEIPGIDPESLDISIVDKTLTLRGARRLEELKEGEAYHRRERWHGQLTKMVELPFAVDSSRVQARFLKGVLSVSLPRAEAEKPRKIVINPS